MSDNLILRLSDERDGYEIRTEGGELLDFITMRELLEADNHQMMISRRVAGAGRRLRVRAFREKLEAT